MNKIRFLVSVLALVSIMLTACGGVKSSDVQATVAAALTAAPVTIVEITSTPEPTATQTATTPPTATLEPALLALVKTATAQAGVTQTSTVAPSPTTSLTATPTITAWPSVQVLGTATSTPEGAMIATPTVFQILIVEDDPRLLRDIVDALAIGLVDAGVSVNITPSLGCPSPLGTHDLGIFDLNLGDDDGNNNPDDDGENCIGDYKEDNPMMLYIIHPIAPRSRDNVQAALNAAGSGAVYVHKSNPFSKEDGLVEAVLELLK